MVCAVTYNAMNNCTFKSLFDRIIYLKKHIYHMNFYPKVRVQQRGLQSKQYEFCSDISGLNLN